MTIDSLEALRDAIRASTGPDDDTRPLEVALAELVLGWTNVKLYPRGWHGDSPHEAGYPRRFLLPAYLDPIAGPGALFAAARERWPECCLSAEALPAKYGCSARFIQSHAVTGLTINELSVHPLLTHALALAMVEAAIQERDNANV